MARRRRGLGSTWRAIPMLHGALRPCNAGCREWGLKGQNFTSAIDATAFPFPVFTTLLPSTLRLSWRLLFPYSTVENSFFRRLPENLPIHQTAKSDRFLIVPSRFKLFLIWLWRPWKRNGGVGNMPQLPTVVTCQFGTAILIHDWTFRSVVHFPRWRIINMGYRTNASKISGISKRRAN